MDNVALISNVFGVVRVLAIVVGVILVALRATGRRRLLGVIGLLIMILGTIVGYGVNALLPMLMNSLQLSYSSIYPVVFGVNLIFDLAALALIVAALCARDQPAPSYPR